MVSATTSSTPCPEGSRFDMDQTNSSTEKDSEKALRKTEGTQKTAW